MNRKKRTLAITLLVLFLLLVPSVWITYREYRQAKLDENDYLENGMEKAGREHNETNAKPISSHQSYPGVGRHTCQPGCSILLDILVFA